MSRAVEAGTQAGPAMATAAAGGRTAAAEPTVFGQPRGLSTLFFTEMWERFTYYGIQAMLILFMVAASGRGGLGITDQTASAIYGLYLGGSYLLSLLGGWIADRLIGGQRAVAAGGVLITIGNVLLASGGTRLFFLGLICQRARRGLLKPNVSAMVAQLYPEGGSRRDAGFSIFYIGINIGSLIGPMLVPVVAAADTAGMPASHCRRSACCSAWCSFSRPAATWVPPGPPRRLPGRAPGCTVWILVAVIGALTALMLSGPITVNPVALAAAGLVGGRRADGGLSSLHRSSSADSPARSAAACSP